MNTFFYKKQNYFRTLHIIFLDSLNTFERKRWNPTTAKLTKVELFTKWLNSFFFGPVSCFCWTDFFFIFNLLLYDGLKMFSRDDRPVRIVTEFFFVQCCDKKKGPWKWNWCRKIVKGLFSLELGNREFYLRGRRGNIVSRLNQTELLIHMFCMTFFFVEWCYLRNKRQRHFFLLDFFKKRLLPLEKKKFYIKMLYYCILFGTVTLRLNQETGCRK